MKIRTVLATVGAAILACACETFPKGWTPPPDKIRFETADVNGTKLSYRTCGSGSRAVVFLEGAQLPCEMWNQQALAFADGWKVVVYDVRGFGKSGPTGASFSHQDDLRALLDKLGIQHASLVGLALGGRIAIEFAVEHPERVDALVLVGPGLQNFPYEDDDPPWRREVRAAVEAGDGARAAEAWLASGFMAPAMEDPQVAPRVRELALANAGAWLQRDTEVPLDPPAINRLGTIRCPTIVLVGSRDVAKILAIADLLDRDIPYAHKKVVVACGHVPNLERPAEFNRIVREFLENNVRDRDD